MSRLHDALQKASDGKAAIVPPGAGVTADAGAAADAAQAAFTVPWTLDGDAGEKPAAPPKEVPPAAAGSSPVAAAAAGPAPVPPHAAHAEIHSSVPDAAEKLIVAEAPATGDSLALAAEQYRKVAAMLHRAQAESGTKLVVVTSANPGEGKSLTVVNLGLTLAESYQRRVLLIDGDLRHPSLDRILGVDVVTGLANGGRHDSNEALVPVVVSANLSLLPSGGSTDDPTAALTSTRLRRTIERARETYDWILVDTPPIGLLSDAKLLAETADGVLFVVEAGKSPYPDLLRAIEAVGRQRLLGVVLNRTRPAAGTGYYYRNYYTRRRGAET